MSKNMKLKVEIKTDQIERDVFEEEEHKEFSLWCSENEDLLKMLEAGKKPRGQKIVKKEKKK